MNRINIIISILIAFSLVFLGGCIKRNLHIKSDPPGATAYFNEEEIGETPVDHDFMWYTYHRIRLMKDGYEPVGETVLIKSPSILWIPFDLIFDMLPCDLWDRRELSYTLNPIEE